MISTCLNHAGQDVGNGTKIPIEKLAIVRSKLIIPLDAEFICS